MPDIAFLEPLSGALGVSVAELLTGNCITNQNKSSNLMRSSVYVCPICGNVIHSVGQAMVSCCGVSLPALEPELCDAEHEIQTEMMETDLYVTIPLHPMTKQHSISFLA